ncbi:MAG: hypothetical protein ACWGQW_10770, partial [bacterium]
MLCIYLILHLSFVRVTGADPPDAQSLHELELVSKEEAVDLVYRYAPTLAFHPEEQYFPCSPLFPLENDEKSEIPPLERLGTVQSRKAHYLGLSLKEKASLARVYYRVRELNIASKEKLIIDYWFYYIWNEYHVRGGLFPVWLDRRHPNDLEHIHLVFGKEPGSDTDVGEPASYKDFHLEAVYSSAHEGRIPSNRYYREARESQMNSHFLVELGSHASAPDANRDGVFTPGTDGRSGYKILWGV